MNTEWFWPAAFCVDGDDIWFVYGAVCVLCKYSLALDKCYVIGEIPTNNTLQEGLFVKILKVGEKIFLIPCWAENIIVYDIKKNNFESIYLEGNGGKLKFWEAYQVRDKIICIPGSYSQIVIVNATDLNIEKKHDISKVIQKDKIDYFNASVLIDDDEILMVSPQSSRIYVYDIEKDMFDRYEIDTNAEGFNFLVYLKDKAILCDDKRKGIYLYNLKTKK